VKKERLLEARKGQNEDPETRASYARLTGMLQRRLSEIESEEGEGKSRLKFRGEAWR